MKSNFNSTDLLLILVNCVPIIGILFFDWTLFSVLISYWTETGVIAFYTFLTFAYTTLRNSSRPSSIIVAITGLGTIISCGAFMVAHLVFIMGLYSIIQPGNGFAGLDLLYKSQIDLLTMTGFLLISHGYSFYYYTLKKREQLFEIISTQQAARFVHKLSGAVMKRIALTHIVLIIGIFIIIFTRSETNVAIIFVIIKILFDLKFHQKKHSSKNSSLAKT